MHNSTLFGNESEQRGQCSSAGSSINAYLAVRVVSWTGPGKTSSFQYLSFSLAYPELTTFHFSVLLAAWNLVRTRYSPAGRHGSICQHVQL